MSKNNFSNVYDDDNIPEIDLPRDNTNANTTNSMANHSNSNASNSITNNSSNNTSTTGKQNYNVEPLPESSRPRKDGPGGA